jgi:hypothetical protein
MELPSTAGVSATEAGSITTSPSAVSAPARKRNVIVPLRPVSWLL